MDNGTIRVVCPADQAVAAKIREQLEEVEMFLLCAKSGAKTGNVRMRRDYVKRALDLILALPVSLQLYFGRRSELYTTYDNANNSLFDAILAASMPAADYKEFDKAVSQVDGMRNHFVNMTSK